MVDQWNILRLDFPKGMRENAILWLVGNYVEIIEKEAVMNENSIAPVSLKGLLKQRKQQSQYSAMPDLGPIAGLDWDLQGIG